jgi:hypothetical protein
MSRFYFTGIILLVAGVLAAGIAVTANSLGDLQGEPISVMAVSSKYGHNNISLLGTKFSVSLTELKKSTLPISISLQHSLNQAMLEYQDLTKNLELPNLHIYLP